MGEGSAGFVLAGRSGFCRVFLCFVGLAGGYCLRKESVLPCRWLCASVNSPGSTRMSTGGCWDLLKRLLALGFSS